MSYLSIVDNKASPSNTARADREAAVGMQIGAMEPMYVEYDSSFWNSAKIDWKRKNNT